MSSGFASTADLADKTISFDAVGPDLYAFTAEGDPNSGIIVGDNGVMVVDAQATPVMAAAGHRSGQGRSPTSQSSMSCSATITPCASSALRPIGRRNFASAGTRSLIVERGKADMDSEIGRFRACFATVESIPGLTWPSVTLSGPDVGLARQA